jgi:hypothetical protein
MVRDDDWGTFDASQEYESKNTLPLFWLCMFSEQDIVMTRDELDEDGERIEPYPYLLAQQSAVVRGMTERRSVIACLDPARLALYDGFCSRIAAATHSYWLLRTKEAVDMSDPETFALELVRTFDGLEEYRAALQSSDAARLRDSWFATYLAEVKQNYATAMLVGASTDGSWLPGEVKARDVKTEKGSESLEASQAPTKKWWEFWK